MHFFFCTPCPIMDVRQVQAKDLELVNSQLKSSVGEVVGFTPGLEGCWVPGSIDGRRWPPVPQPSQAQGVRWKMVDD